MVFSFLIQVKDNVVQHWTAEAIRLITSRDAIIIHLPPYSPEFKPIELEFGCLTFYIQRHVERLGGTNRIVQCATPSHKVWKHFQQTLWHNISDIQDILYLFDWRQGPVPLC